MVDDFESNLDHMKEAGMARTLILIDQPWNRARSDYQIGKNRFKSLGQFVEKLLGHEIVAQLA
ncbi:hypothetical protein ALP12_200461 [Pseudomonas savastanoi pv. phaseolicola]|nr:hypothetical protein ALP12_200461 [Pseudomonas savastanoi pv. phaseolicola]